MTIIDVKPGGTTVAKVEKPPDQTVPPNASQTAKAVSFVSSNILPAPPIVSPFESQIVQQMKEYCDPATFSEDRVVKLIRKLKVSQRENAADDISHAVNEVMNAYYDEEPMMEEERKTANTPQPTSHSTVIGCAERPTQTESGTVIPLPYPGPITPGAVENAVADKEQTELQKAIEESLLSNQQSKSLSSYLSALPENPEDLLRTQKPVGIHNIGQTCWFSVIAQLLFHLPKYRRLIYELTPDLWSRDTTAVEQSETKQVCERDILVAIRLLFAQMEAGNRRFLDPAPCLSVISTLNKKLDNDAGELVGAQQDAIEMLMRITDWLERAMQLADAATRKPLSIQTTEQSQRAVSSLEAMEISPSLPSRAGSTMDVQIGANADDVSIGENDVIEPTSTMEAGDGQLLQAAESSSMEEEFARPRTPEKQADQMNSSTVWVDSPLQPIFHGTCVEEKHREDGSVQSFRTTNTLQLFLLDVDHQNLHDAFEEHNFSPSNQIWYESLPAVLIVSLKRFRFDPTTGGTHKVNTAFNFPTTLYMDRYLSRNASTVTEMMRVRCFLREQLAEVRAQLKGYEKYPIGSNSARLDDILLSATRYMEGYKETTKTYCEEGEKATKSFVEDRPAELPRLLEDVDPQIIEGLKQIREAVEMRENALREQEASLTSRINGMFERNELHREEYQLHGVVIHEGEANMGHYWTYIKDAANSWQKMNDRAVDEATWEQVSRDAYGKDLQNTSAYCMVYVRADADWLMREEETGDGDICSSALDRLPADLRERLSVDNDELLHEIDRYRLRSTENTHQIIVPEKKRDVAIFDPINLFHPLTDQLNLLFEPGLRDRFEHEVVELRSLMESVSRSNLNQELAFGNCLKALLSGPVRSVLSRMDPVAFEPGHTKKPLALQNYTPEHVRGMYETLITEWYEISSEMVPRDPRQSVLDLWNGLGLGMPAKLHRYILAKSLRNAEFFGLSELAKEDVISFEQNGNCCDYLLIYQRTMYITEMVRHMWHLLKACVLGFAKQPVFSTENINTYPKTWLTILTPALQVERFYQKICSALSSIAADSGRKVNIEKCVAEQFLIRGLIIVPFLHLYQFIVYCLGCEEVTEAEISSLLSESALLQLFFVLNRISGWANGTEDGKEDQAAHKVIVHVRETLDLLSNSRPELSGGFKEVIARKLLEAANPNSRFSIPNSSLNVTGYSPDMFSEFFMAHRTCVEVGLSDAADADCTYTRLMQETSLTISSLMPY